MVAELNSKKISPVVNQRFRALICVVSLFSAATTVQAAEDQTIEFHNDNTFLRVGECERRVSALIPAFELQGVEGIWRQGWQTIVGTGAAAQLPSAANDGPDHPAFRAQQNAQEGPEPPVERAQQAATTLLLTLGNRRIGLRPDGSITSMSDFGRPAASPGVAPLAVPLVRTTGSAYLRSLQEDTKPFGFEDSWQARLRRYLEARESAKAGADPTARAQNAGLRYLVLQVNARQLSRIVRGAQIVEGPSRTQASWEFRPIGARQLQRSFSATRAFWSDDWRESTNDHRDDFVYFLFHPRVAAWESSFGIWHGMSAGTEGRSEAQLILQELDDALFNAAQGIGKNRAHWQDGRDGGNFQIEAPFPLHDLMGVAAGPHRERVIRVLQQHAGLSLEDASALVYSGYSIASKAEAPRPMQSLFFYQSSTPFEHYALTDPLSPREFWTSSIPEALQTLDYQQFPEVRAVAFWLPLYGSKVRVTASDGKTVEGTVNSFRYSGLSLPFRDTVSQRQFHYLSQLVLRLENGSHYFVYLEDEARLQNAPPRLNTRAISIEVLGYQPNPHQVGSDERLPITRAMLGTRDFLEHLQDMLLEERNTVPLRRLVELKLD